MPVGPLTELMLQHMVLMNLIVPGSIHILRPIIPTTASGSWPQATATQLVLLWGWHSPPALEAATSSPMIMLAMSISLTAGAAWFWLAIYATPAGEHWRSIFALLVTGKLFCLLGALLVFAPRSLFGAAADSHVVSMSESLADQQMAGLVMLVACPLIYITAGVVMASRWFLRMEAKSRADG